MDLHKDEGYSGVLGTIMIKKSSFEIVEVAREFMAVPVGETGKAFKGVVALNEASAYLLQHMSTPRTKEDLIELLTKEYQVKEDVAERDIAIFVQKASEIGLIGE